MYALVSVSRFSSISTGTAVERRNRESTFGKTLTLDVRRFSSCRIGRLMPFDVRMRLRCASGREKTASPSGMLVSSQSAKAGLRRFAGVQGSGG